MAVLSRLFFIFHLRLIELRASFILAGFLIFCLISNLLFTLAGEVVITSTPLTFIYFVAETASTIGYGTFTFQTDLGRLVAILWFFPGSLILYSTALAKIAAVLLEGIKRMINGQGDFRKLDGATVIIGFHKQKTRLIVNNLVAGNDDDHTIILLAKEDDDVTIEKIRLIKADRLDALESLKRAAVENAAKIIVYSATDAETFNICLAIRELNDHVHIAAYFDDADTARRANMHAGVEIVLSTSCETLVRAAQDPGSSRILMELTSAEHGPTIFSASFAGVKELSTGAVMDALSTLGATFLAISNPSSAEICFKPFPVAISQNDIFYYLSDRRLTASQIQDAFARNHTLDKEGAERVRISI